MTDDMSRDKAFQWVPFYEELADKLLTYRDRQDELFALIKRLIPKYPLMEYLHFEKEDWWGPRGNHIDPFSIFGIFNRGVRTSHENRTMLAAALAVAFNMQEYAPTQFTGIPVLDPRKSFFEGVGEMWELFSAAIDSADKGAFSEKFKVAFEKAVAVKGNGLAYVTIGLFWIRPRVFMPLDKNSREYIATKYGLSISGNTCTGDEYAKYLEALKFEVEKASPSMTFPEVSEAAWSEGSKEDIANGSQHYWWLTANPGVWSYSDIDLGTVFDYTLRSEDGHKRRVYQNYLDAQVGDLVIGYESTPRKEIVALCRVVGASDDQAIYFEKLLDLYEPVRYDKLKSIPELKDMEFFASPQGSFFKLTEDEFNIISGLMRGGMFEPYSKADFLSEVYLTEGRYDSLCELLRNRKNVILQGAPGVGKTFAAERLAWSMIGKKDESRVQIIQFHQNYSYEDFIMGYRPVEDGFELKPGVFYDFCALAADHPEEEFFFIIDEINRGNMSKIFGECLMLIEKDYRGKRVPLSYEGWSLSVPENIYLIGMMNTADRSLALIDYALRRRFSFFEMEPAFESDRFKEYQKDLGNERLNRLIDLTKELNKAIMDEPSLGPGFRIGHSYFCGRESVGCTDEWITAVINYDLIPIVEEYWFDDTSKVSEWRRRLQDI